MSVFIRYRDNEGNITEREITNISIESDDKINSFCKLKGENRTFKIENIISIIDPKTREIENNPRKYLGLSSEAESPLDRILPAVKFLKLFSKQLRGFNKRERSFIIQFVKETAQIENCSDDILDEWLRDLWCCVINKYYDIYEFKKGDQLICQSFVEQIPPDLIDSCRDTTLKIAIGSGRKKIPNDLITWIHETFPI